MRTTTIFAQTHTSERTMSPTGLFAFLSVCSQHLLNNTVLVISVRSALHPMPAWQWHCFKRNMIVRLCVVVYVWINLIFGTFGLCSVAHSLAQKVTMGTGWASMSSNAWILVSELTVTFLARDSILSALYTIARPSVRHTGRSVENGCS